MNIIVLVPNVVRRYIASFPETTNNAYKYFNYDHRVVDERVQRFDTRMPYKGPQDFTDMDYDSLVAFAQQGLNPTLAKYSKTVACEDALNMAIRSFNNGMFDGKINASRYNVLLQAMKDKTGPVPVQAKKHTEKKDTKVTQQTLKNLGLKREKIPHAFQVGQKVKGPTLVRQHGDVILKKEEK
jgi:hypothetical protein